MLLLSRIIAKEWFKSLLGSIIVLFLLVTVGDIINGFLQNYPARRVFIEYALKMPDLAGKMIPISALLGTLFAINKLKSHSELMAILAGGYSASRIYALVLFCSISVAIFQFLNLGFLVPQANKIKRQEFEKSRRNESKYLARSKIGKTGLLWYKTDNYFTSFKAFDSKNKNLKDVTIYFLSKDKRLDSIYKAKVAEYVGKNQWQLKGINITQSLSSEGFPKITNAAHLPLKLAEDPEDFTQFESDITTLNIFNLGSFISRLKETDINPTEYEVMYYEKISLSLICIIFSLFPLAGIFNPNRRAAGFGKSIVVTLVFTIIFWGIHSGGIALGNSAKVPAYVATLGVPFLFMIIIAVTFFRNKKL